MAYERPWQFAMNVLTAQESSLSNMQKRCLWQLKAMLTGQVGGITQGLWTVVGSSDAATAGMDNLDRWGATFDATKLVRNSAGVHSWIVLKSPSGFVSGGSNPGPVYLCLDYSTTADQTTYGFHARAVFTGGSISARPTSTDETNWIIPAASAHAPTTLNSVRFNLIMSSTGDFLWWLVRQTSGFIENAAFVSAVVGANGQDGYPYIAWRGFANGSNSFLGASLSSVAHRNYLGTMGNWGNTVPQLIPTGATDLIDGTVTDVPCWVIASSGTQYHMRGRLPDIGQVAASGNAASPAQGSVVRDGSNNVIYTVIGPLLVPCNTVPDMS